MIEILKGNSVQLQSHCIDKYTEKEKAFLIIGDGKIALPYTVIRLLLPQLRKLIGDNEVDELLRKHKLVTSLIFPSLTPLLSAHDKLEQSIISARLSSNITHNRIAKTTINDTCVAFIIDAVKSDAIKIIIPDVRHLDVGSIDILKLLLKQYPDTAPDIVLGFNPDWGKETIDRENGLVWYSSVDALINIQAFVYSFQAIAINVFEINSSTTTFEAEPLENKLDKIDDAIALQANALLTSANYIDNLENNALIMDAIWRSFKLYDFTMALRLALPFMEKSPEISRKDQGEMHHIIGLSAHNRQFFSQGNENLGKFLERSFRESLKFEENPENRIGAIYRLIVTLSRRLNRHEEAFEAVNFAITELDTNTFNPAHHALLKGWVFNINSFVLMRSARIDDAIKYHEDAFNLLKDVTSDIEHLNKEIRFTQAVLAENLTTLSSLLNDRQRMEFWCKIEESYSKEWPGLSAVPFAEWQSFYYKGFELKKALENAQKGIQKAAGNFEYILEYFFTMSLADIHIRLGHYKDALTYFNKSLLFQSQIAYDFTSAITLKIGVALSMIGVNKFNEALALTKEMDLEYENDSPFDLIEIYIVQAFAYTHLKEFDKAEETINSAIDMAVDTGNFDILISTACKAGDLCQLMGRNEDAASAYNQALEIMESQSDAANASNIIAVNLGLYETNKTEIEPLLSVVKSFPAALKVNYAIWSDLDRFLKCYLEVVEKAEAGLFKSCKNELAIVLKVAGQHEECKKNMSILKKRDTEKLVNKISRN
ncbi:MAG: tetratricopeptide repeat protein [Crocinitomix sp.]|nr:tetratricopeptide repeat protein [Crocinitomix sp.]